MQSYYVINQYQQPLCWLTPTKTIYNTNCYFTLIRVHTRHHISTDFHIFKLPLLAAFIDTKTHSIPVLDKSNTNYHQLITNKDSINDFVKNINHQDYIYNTKHNFSPALYIGKEMIQPLKTIPIKLEIKSHANELAQAFNSPNIKVVNKSEFKQLTNSVAIIKPANVILIDGQALNVIKFEHLSRFCIDGNYWAYNHNPLSKILENKLASISNLPSDIQIRNKICYQIVKSTKLIHYINVGYSPKRWPHPTKSSKMLNHAHFFYGGKEFPDLKSPKIRTIPKPHLTFPTLAQPKLPTYTVEELLQLTS